MKKHHFSFLLGLVGIASIFTPSGATASVFISNYNNSSIVEFSADGTSGAVFATAGSSLPLGLAFDRAGNLYAVNDGTHTIQKFAPDGGSSSLFASTGSLSGASGIAFDKAAIFLWQM